MKTQFTASFAKDIKNIRNRHVRKLVKETIVQVEDALSLHEVAGVKKLKGSGNYYRIRAGEYRLGIILEGDTVVFVRCLDRKEVYRYFP